MKKTLFILEIIVLIFFLFWHLKIGLVRYFDADEFAHLHWGYSFSIGEKPFTDFFYFFPPFFLYPIAALFKVFGRTTAVLIYARIFIFFVFLATCGILFQIAKKWRNTSFALLTLIIFAFLPLPFDKLVEVRPDLVATGLALLGLYLFIKGYEGNGEDKGKYFFLSGLAYATSLGFVPKTVFFLVPVGLVLVVSYLRNLSGLSHVGKEKKAGLSFLLGMAAVGIVILLIISSFGNLSFAIYSMTKMTSEVTKVLGSKFYMRPDIFFYPNDTYYGFGGWTAGIIVNLIIYVTASIWAIGRLISSLSHEDNQKCLREFILAGSFFANFAAFVYFYPLKHAQYLIPVAPFIAFYFADLLYFVILRSESDEGSRLLSEFPTGFFAPLRMTILVSILLLITVVGLQINQKKVTWVNKPTMDKLNYFLQTIPAKAPVYDLTGESMFFHNGYYFCCLPYGQYEEALYFRLPDIEKEMKKRGTKYVYLGWLGRLNEIPSQHAKYINDNFSSINADKTLLKRN